MYIKYVFNTNQIGGIMIKRLVLLLAVLALTSGSAFAEPAAVFTIDSNEYLKYGQLITTDAAPRIIENRTMIPIRPFADALSINTDNIVWNPMDQSIVIFKDDSTILFTIGSYTYKKNGSNVSLDSPPVIVDGRTYIPLRSAAQALGTEVAWDSATRTITIESSSPSNPVKEETATSLIYENGDKYEGAIKDHKPNGKGTMKFVSDGSVYTGDFLNGIFSGPGILTLSDGTVLSGTFSNEGVEGQGKLYKQGSVEYIGLFKNGLPYGKGTTKDLQNDMTYIGEVSGSVWAWTGEGILHVTDSLYLKGAWDNGKYVEGLTLYGKIKSTPGAEIKYVIKNSLSELKKGTILAFYGDITFEQVSDYFISKNLTNGTVTIKYVDGVYKMKIDGVDQEVIVKRISN